MSLDSVERSLFIPNVVQLSVSFFIISLPKILPILLSSREAPFGFVNFPNTTFLKMCYIYKLINFIPSPYFIVLFLFFPFNVLKHNPQHLFLCFCQRKRMIYISYQILLYVTEFQKF